MGVFYPNAGCLAKATILQTALAGGKMHLFKDGFVPTVTTTKAELDAQEADFDGYTAGGETVAAWLSPLLDPAGGASIESGTVQFEWAHDTDDVTNLIGGWYYTTAAGQLIVGTFPVSIPMEGPGQGIPLNVKLVEASGQ